VKREQEEVRRDVFKCMKAIEMLRVHVKKQRVNLHSVFKTYDENQDGKIDKRELRKVLRDCKVGFS